jgi:hypothetical protein
MLVLVAVAVAVLAAVLVLVHQPTCDPVHSRCRHSWLCSCAARNASAPALVSTCMSTGTPLGDTCRCGGGEGVGERSERVREGEEGEE